MVTRGPLLATGLSELFMPTTCLLSAMDLGMFSDEGELQVQQGCSWVAEGL